MGTAEMSGKVSRKRQTVALKTGRRRTGSSGAEQGNTLRSGGGRKILPPFWWKDVERKCFLILPWSYPQRGGSGKTRNRKCLGILSRTFQYRGAVGERHVDRSDCRKRRTNGTEESV